MMLYLIRHGQTDLNKESRICGGDIDIELNRTGIAQAQALMPFFRGKKLDRIFCSPLKRARQTASIVFGDEEIIFDDLLKEKMHGPMNSLNLHEIKEMHPVYCQDRLDNLYDAKYPGQESLRDVSVRMKQFLEREHIITSGKDFCLVCHHGNCITAIQQILGLSDQTTLKVSFPTGSAMEIDIASRKARRIMGSMVSEVDTWESKPVQEIE